jgi:hypothetical protein
MEKATSAAGVEACSRLEGDLAAALAEVDKSKAELVTLRRHMLETEEGLSASEMESATVRDPIGCRRSRPMPRIPPYPR